MWIIVTYDIKTDKKRNRLSKKLLKFGIRTQFSFFECDVNEKELNIIKKIVKKYSDADDLVTIYKTKNAKRVGEVEYLEIDDLVF
jgi:CRISPR-associated protein Cas2